MVQCSWSELRCRGEAAAAAPLSVEVVRDGKIVLWEGLGGGGAKRTSFCPAFALIRNECRACGAAADWLRQLYALAYAGLPALNSLSSVLMFQERPVVHGELRKIERRLGHEAFPPLVEQVRPDDLLLLLPMLVLTLLLQRRPPS